MKFQYSKWLELASVVSMRSKDPSTKVGCVIIDETGQLISEGYNSFSKGVNESEDRLNNREEKYRFVLHAEMKAILNSDSNLSGATAFVTHAPCCNCMAAMAEVGIKKVVVKEVLQSWQDRFPDSYRVSSEIRDECGIEFIEGINL